MVSATEVSELVSLALGIREAGEKLAISSSLVVGLYGLIGGTSEGEEEREGKQP